MILGLYPSAFLAARPSGTMGGSFPGCMGISAVQTTVASNPGGRGGRKRSTDLGDSNASFLFGRNYKVGKLHGLECLETPDHDSSV